MYIRKRGIRVNEILVGRYLPGNSWLHRLDPRSKFIFSLVFLLGIFQMNSLVDFIWIQLLLCGIIRVSRIPLYYLIRSLRPFLWFVLLFALFQVFVVREGTVLFSIISWEITSKGVWLGGILAARFIDMLLITSLLTLTTTPMEMTHAIAKLLSPLKRWKVPVHDIAFMVSLTLRFIPTFIDEAEILLKAQASRGMDFHEGTIGQKCKGIAGIVIPLFIQMFKKVDTVSLALEARGFRCGGARTAYRQLQWKKADTVCLSLAVCIVGGLWYF